jgi:nucleolar pre-ribosomal-associated protein 1
MTPFHERDQLVYTLRLIRHVLPSPDTDDTVDAARPHDTARLPTLTSLFIAHALRAIANPGHFLYPLTSRFLLQRPTFDAYDVPMLFGMLYSYSDEFKRERGWIIRLLRDGVRSEAVSRATGRCFIPIEMGDGKLTLASP